MLVKFAQLTEKRVIHLRANMHLWSGAGNTWLLARVMLRCGVSKFFRPNLDRHGRIARGVIGSLCLVAGIIVAGDYSLWGLILVVAGLFAIFEATARWCVVRACGIKTKF